MHLGRGGVRTTNPLAHAGVDHEPGMWDGAISPHSRQTNTTYIKQLFLGQLKSWTKRHFEFSGLEGAPWKVKAGMVTAGHRAGGGGGSEGRLSMWSGFGSWTGAVSQKPPNAMGVARRNAAASWACRKGLSNPVPPFGEGNKGHGTQGARGSGRRSQTHLILGR